MRHRQGDDAEWRARAALAEAGRHLSERGLSPGSSGNLSVRVGDMLLATPTGVGLHRLGPEQIAAVPLAGGGGSAPDGPRPSKEVPLHTAAYRARAEAAAVVHLHSPFAVALSCLSPQTWPGGELPWLTPYQVLKVGELGRVPYAPPGSQQLADAVADVALQHASMLMANHGSLAVADSLSAAVDTAEEIEATAHLLVTLGSREFTPLTEREASELRSSR